MPKTHFAKFIAIKRQIKIAIPPKSVSGTLIMQSNQEISHKIKSSQEISKNDFFRDLCSYHFPSYLNNQDELRPAIT